VLAFLALWERCRKAERVNNFAGNLRVAYHLTLSLSSRRGEYKFLILSDLI